MPFVDIKVIAGAFTPEEKRRLVESVSEAVIAIEGEALRPATHVVITETPSGEWAIGGQALTAEEVRAKRASAPAA
ncbi:tautomerase family protein [Streptomyces sp. NPDC047022]|uniref:tautomerase family protein n=1 Tax=Streptomyces sp. NPDC047022 TaxID=3155737 RepID=UPI003404CDD4